MHIVITNKDSDKHSIRSRSEPHKCDTSYADYEFISYNFIKKLTWDSHKKHALSVFIIHIHKISDKMNLLINLKFLLLLLLLQYLLLQTWRQNYQIVKMFNFVSLFTSIRKSFIINYWIAYYLREIISMKLKQEMQSQ